MIQPERFCKNGSVSITPMATAFPVLSLHHASLSYTISMAPKYERKWVFIGKDLAHKWMVFYIHSLEWVPPFT